jgi:Domain of unknown function (DU1801)
VAQRKTQPETASVSAFLAAALTEIMGEVSGAAPVMWGPSIVGFGESQYTNTTGTHDWFQIGFSPRKTSLTLYLPGPLEAYGDELGRLGPHSTGKSCLYIKDLRAVDEGVLRELITKAVAS